MDRLRSPAIALALCVVAGCQAQKPADLTPAAAPTATASPPVAPAAAAADAAASGGPANPKADAANRLAESQAKSIEALLAARSAGEKGVTVVEPTHAGPAPGPAPAAADPPPKPAAATAETLRPVPSISDYRPPATPAAVQATAVPPAPAAPPPDAAPPAVSSDPPAAPVRPVTPPLQPPSAGDGTPARLDRAAADRPRDLATQFDAQLARLVADKEVPSAESLAGLTEEDRNVLAAVLDGLSVFRNRVRNDDNLLIGDKIAPLLEMAERLRGRADLRIVNLNLVHRATDFGKYDPITPLTFTNGVNTAKPPVLYMEMENVNPTLGADKMWQTALVMDVVLYNADGRSVWAVKAIPVTDHDRNRRRDYFTTVGLPLPHTLAAGAYKLKVTLTDPGTHRVSESGLTLTYVNPPAGTPAGAPTGASVGVTQ